MPQLPFIAHQRHSPVPLADRTPAHLVITPELLAATAPATLAFARSFHRIWFAVLQSLCDRHLVTMFDTFVIGPPDPLLLEVAARLRRFHEADDDGAFCDENDDVQRQWELEHDWDEDGLDDDNWDDDDFDEYPPEPPTMVERAYHSMRRCQEFERIALWRDFDHSLSAQLEPGRDRIFELIHLSMRAESLLADVAPLVRLNSGIVIDVRLDHARRPHRRWSA